ncbi:MAG: hypothetical protein ABI890_00370 [Lapillicoccus sp.]
MFGEDLAASVAEGLRWGVDGWVDDDLAFAVPWGFSLAEIAVPTFVWHGSEDLMAPFAHDHGLPRTSRVRRHDCSRARVICPSARVLSTGCSTIS